MESAFYLLCDTKMAQHTPKTTPPPLKVDQIILGWFFLKIEDNGIGLLTHHLPVGFEECCFFASAYAAGCWLVEADSTSRYSKTENF
jgi:hypothetical protein